MDETLRADAYYVTREVAAVLRVSVSTLEYWRRRGGGPPYIKLPNGKVRYMGGTVVQWLALLQHRTTGDERKEDA